MEIVVLLPNPEHLLFKLMKVNLLVSFFLIGNFILHVSGKALILFAVSADDAIKVALEIRTASKDYHCKNSFHGVSGISRYDIITKSFAVAIMVTNTNAVIPELV